MMLGFSLNLQMTDSPCYVKMPNKTKSWCQWMVLHENYKDLMHMLTWDDIIVIKMDTPIEWYSRKVHNGKTELEFISK